MRYDSWKASATSAQMLETITYESWGDMGTLSNHRNHTYKIIRYSQKWHNKLYRKLVIYVCVGVCVINEAWRYDFMLTSSMKLSCIGATIDPWKLFLHFEHQWESHEVGLDLLVWHCDLSWIDSIAWLKGSNDLSPSFEDTS